jgi:hypothetical protein
MEFVSKNVPPSPNIARVEFIDGIQLFTFLETTSFLA